MKTRLLLIPLLAGSMAVFAATGRAETTGPSADALASAVKSALVPDGSSSRDLTIEIHLQGVEKVTWQGRQFRKTVDGSRRVLTVLTHPASVAGFAVLMKESSPSSGSSWMYVPPVRRVRHLIHEGRYENFLGTDFSASTFGVMRFDPGMRVVGKVARDGVDAWQLEETLNPHTGYSKVITWVAIDTHLPIRREYYDTSNKLWKVETREDVVTEGGVSTPQRVVMQDLHEGSRSVLQYRGVRSRVDLDDSLFEPAGLARAAEAI